MYRFIGCLLLWLFFSGCNEEFKTEKEEIEFWNQKVITPAHELLYRDKKLEPAVSLYDSLLNAVGQSSPLVKAARYSLMANYYYFFTQDNRALSERIDSALSFFSTKSLQAHYPRAYVGYLLFGGEIAFRLSDYAKANQYYFMAKQSADLYLDPCEASGFSYNMGMVSYRQQNFAQSAVYFKQAYEAQATCAAQTRAVILQQQEIQSNIGLCLVKLKQYDSALLHFNKALEITRRNKDSLGRVTVDVIQGVVLGNIGKIYVATNKLSTAEKLFKQSIALNARPGYEVRDAMLVKAQLAEVYKKEARHAEMFSLLQSVRSALDTIPDAEAEMNWRRLMSGYYKELNQPDEELHYFKTYINLRDSIAETKEQLTQADIARQLKEKEQQLQIALLKKNNQLSLISLWVVIALSLMAVVIIFLIYQNYRRSKKNVAALTQLNRRVSEQKTELEKANKEKDRILHVVAHDLRNPIGITAYVADLILMEDRSEYERASLQMIKDASEQALYLTNELLGFREGKKDKGSLLQTDLAKLVKNTVQSLRYRAAEKEQEINLHIEAEEIFINCDPESINRTLSNLLVNAIKFSPPQGEIRITLTKNGSNALVSLADNGIGIPADQQAMVFDRFTAARRKGTSGERSYGLGLSICKEIVEEHGGTINFESKEGAGTTFYVALPLADNA